MAADISRPLIVVGMDGSPGSRAALQWAVAHAELIGATVQAVLAWQLPETHSYTSRDTEADARITLNTAIDAALGPHQRARVTALVTPGRPGHVLVEASSGAQLLVVGSHGRGDLVERLIGSVSQYCVTHASCPVVVVPKALTSPRWALHGRGRSAVKQVDQVNSR